MPRTEEFPVYGVASEQYLKNRIADSQAQIDNFQLPLLPADTKLTFDGESLAFLGNKMAARIHEIVAKLRVRKSGSLNDQKNAIIENLSKAAEQIGVNICETPPVMYMDAYYKQYNRLSAGLLHSYFVYMGSYVRLQFLEDSKSPFAIILCCYYDGSALSSRESPKKLPLEKELQWTDSYEFPLEKQIGEDAPQYNIICAGSLLGVALHQGTSFPVGKVEFLDLYPLSFFEFMTAMGKGQYVELLQKGDFEMANTFAQEYVDLLKHYYYVGGMPEVVQSFAENKDFGEAREIQQRILSAYEQDFSKHAPNEAVPRIRMLWNSIPTQLAKENKKFIYGLLKEGARAKDYELALLWLTDCGLVRKVHRVNAPSLPLKAYEDLKAFKLFLLDVGLLSCMVGLRQDTLLDGNEIFKEVKGALTEQYVLQQLKTIKGVSTYYWTADRGTAEVDFVIDNGSNIIPIEVKAEANLQAKSLKVYREKFEPKVCVRAAMVEYKKEDWLVNLPLWAVEAL